MKEFLEKRKQNRSKPSIKIPRKTGKIIQRDASLLTENFHVTGLFLKSMDKLPILVLSQLSNVDLASKA